MSIELRTERLILRPPRLEDLTPLAHMLADEETARHIGGVQSRHGAWRALMAMAGSWLLAGFAMVSVIERATARLIGRLGLWHPEGRPGTQIGRTEMVHVIAPDNLASQAVARKLGSANRGPGQLPAPPDSTRVDIWGQTHQEWRRRRV